MNSEPRDPDVLHPNPDHPIRVAARQAGKSYLAGQPAPLGTGRPPRMTLQPGHLDQEIRRAARSAGGLAVVAWRSKRLFTYVGTCVGINTSDPRWFISGKGDFYQGNEFTHTEFIERVLMHDEVTDILVGIRFHELYHR